MTVKFSYMRCAEKKEVQQGAARDGISDNQEVLHLAWTFYFGLAFPNELSM